MNNERAIEKFIQKADETFSLTKEEKREILISRINEYDETELHNFINNFNSMIHEGKNC